MTPIEPPKELVFHPLDEKARRTGQVQHTTFSLKGVRNVWVFFPNGLQMIGSCRNDPTVYCGIGIRNGSRHDKIPGTAHALEHMIPDDVLREGWHPLLEPIAARYGMRGNASTGYEQARYYNICLRAGWKPLLEALLEIVFKPRMIDTKRWEKEQPAILQEIRQRDTEDARIEQEMFPALYQHEPLYVLRQLTGTEESVRSLHVNDLLETHRRTHLPQNALIMISGIKDPLRALPIIEATLHRLHRASNPFPRQTLPPFQREGNVSDITIHATIRESASCLILRSKRFVALHKRGAPSLRLALGFIKSVMNDAITHAFRRKTGWIYGYELEHTCYDADLVSISIRMFTQEAHMEEVKKLWPDLWGRVCRQISQPNRVFKKVIEKEVTNFRFCQARERAEPKDTNVSVESMFNIWLDQKVHRPIPSGLNCSVQDLRDALKLAHTLADLHWQAIKILPK